MVNQYNLRSTWIFRILSNKNVSRMSITVDVTVQEYHLRKNAYQNISALLCTPKFLIQSFYVVNLDTFYILHQNSSFGTFENIHNWNV